MPAVFPTTCIPQRAGITDPLPRFIIVSLDHKRPWAGRYPLVFWDRWPHFGTEGAIMRQAPTWALYVQAA